MEAIPAPTLAALPVAASLDLTKTVAEVRDGFAQTITLLDLIRDAKRSYSLQLRTALDSTRYAASVAMARIQQFNSSGGTGAETAATIDGLSTLLSQYTAQLQVVKKLWATEIGGVVPPTTWLQRLSTPRSDTSYLLWGMAGLSLYLLYTVTRR